MKKWLSLILALAMAVSLVGCGGNPSAEESGDQGTTQSDDDKDTLRVISKYDPGTFEPGNNDEQSYNRITRQIYETLFRFDEDGVPQPWLATGYEWVDPTHIRITLRDDVKFSNGTPFTSADVLWTIVRAKEEALPIPHFLNVLPEECVAEDDYTCVIALSTPMATFPAHLACPEAVIGCKSAYEADPDWLGGAVVGTGPYKLVEYVPGDYIRFTANEYYWREGEPKTPNLEYRLIEDDATRSTEAKALGADIIIEPNLRERANIDAVDGIHIVEGQSVNTRYLMMNCKKTPLDNIKVREAISRAIDVKATIQLTFGDFGMPASGYICPGILGYNAETYQKYYGAGHDVETAKALLAEAGYPDGLDLEITLSSSDASDNDIAEAMQSQLLEAGINLTLNKLPNAAMREYLATGQHQMCLYAFTAQTYEAEGMLAQLQPGSSALTRIGYDNQAFFDLCTQGQAVMDREERGKIWEECIEILMQDYVMVPLWHKALCAAVKDNVEGFELALDYEEHYFQWAEKT